VSNRPDHNVRAEARGSSYLLANNIFQLEASQCLSADEDSIAMYIRFLETIVGHEAV
jgi:hypothetical protein